MSWIVAKTRSRQEQKAVDRITAAGAEAFLPKIMEKSGDIVPLFPRYVFVFIQSQWRFLLSTIGVTGIIRSGGGEGPAWLDQRIIDKIKIRQNQDGIVVLPKKDRFDQGQSVRINAGCFEGRIGLYQGANSFERETVLLNLLGRMVPVSVSESSVVAVA